MARKHKVKYVFPAESLCGFVKADGKPCGRAKARDSETGDRLKHCTLHLKAESSGVDLGLLPGAEYELPPDMQLDSFSDLAKILSDTLNRVRRGQLSTKIGQTVATLANPLIKALIAREKLDPAREAKRQLTREEIIRRARHMPAEDFNKIAENRDQFIIDVVETELDDDQIKLLEKQVSTEKITDKKVKAKIEAMRRSVDEAVDMVNGDFSQEDDDDDEFDSDED